MELLSSERHIDFLGKAKYAIFFSSLVIAASIYLWVIKGSSVYGIDFLGGHELVAKIEGTVKSDEVRRALEKAGIQNSIVQSFELGSDEFSIRLGGEVGDSKTVRELIERALRDAFADRASIVKSDFVGPTVGNELRRDALIAMVVGLLGILIYIAMRFEMAFAFGAVMAVFHDVLVCFGVYLFAGFTVTMGTVAAALTIVGYSVNDTIIIFDRVREELRKSKNEPLAKTVNESINVTLSRTVITSLLTFFSALSLLIVGGGAISDLSLFLVVGIITGTYSTIFIASPLALFWERSRKRA